MALRKRPAAAAEAAEAEDEVAEEDAGDEDELVLKRPAAAGAGMALRKRPAAAAEAAEDEDEAAEEDAGDEDEHVLKRPAAAGALKRPAAAGAAEGEAEEEGEERAASGGAAGANSAVEARAAVREVQKCRREIDKLTAEREKFQQKMKENKSATNAAEKRLEELQAVARKKSASLGKQKAAKMRKIMEGKATRARSGGEKAAQVLKAASKRLKQMKDGLSSVKSKAEDAESVFKRAQRTYDEAKKRCAELKKQGEEVPDEGEKDISAAGAWKPPGVRAAKDRDAAKAALAKVKPVHEKAQEALQAKEKVAGAIKEKMSAAKQRKQELEENAAAPGKGHAAKVSLKRPAASAK